MEKLSPYKLYIEYKNEHLDISSVVNCLISYIENSDSIIVRAESLKNLGKILNENALSNQEKIFQILENCVISDESSQVRNIALALIFHHFYKKAKRILRHIIRNETSALILRNIINIFEVCCIQVENSLKYELEQRIFNIFGTNIEEAKFFLDLQIINPIQENDYKIPELTYKRLTIHSMSEWKSTSSYVLRKGHLRFLKLDGNYIFRIPKSITNLSHLNYLDLSKNNINSFPKVILKLERLKRLKLSQNMRLRRFSESAYVFAKQKLTQKYKVEGVVTQEAPVLALFEMLVGRKMEKEKIIDDYRSITYYELNETGNVRKIEIIPNEDFYFTFIPSQIIYLKYLEELIIPFNTIKFLPDTLGKLKSLRVLNFQYNKIEVLPPSIGCLESLEFLYLSHNDIQFIPNTILHLTSLKFIGLHDNNIEELSPKLEAFLDSIKSL